MSQLAKQLAERSRADGRTRSRSRAHTCTRDVRRPQCADARRTAETGQDRGPDTCVPSTVHTAHRHTRRPHHTSGCRRITMPCSPPQPDRRPLASPKVLRGRRLTTSRRRRLHRRPLPPACNPHTACMPCGHLLRREPALTRRPELYARVRCARVCASADTPRAARPISTDLVGISTDLGGISASAST